MSYRVSLSPETLQQLQKEIEPLVPWFDALVDQVVITDENATIIYANKATEGRTGFSLAEIIGKNPGDLWGGGKMKKEDYEKMWHTIKTLKQPFVGEIQNKRKDGTPYWQEIRISPILDAKQDVRFFIGIEPDVTARKTMEEETKEQYDVIRRWDRVLAEKNSTVIDLKQQVEDLKKQLKNATIKQ